MDNAHWTSITDGFESKNADRESIFDRCGVSTDTFIEQCRRALDDNQLQTELP